MQASGLSTGRGDIAPLWGNSHALLDPRWRRVPFAEALPLPRPAKKPAKKYDVSGREIRQSTRPMSAPSPALAKRRPITSALPDVWALVAPRKALMGLGLVLMAINRVAGLVLPFSTKFLIDNVIGRRQVQLLLPIVGAVLGATLIQGMTSFALTQLLSKAAQRLIAELRLKVFSHVSRLPVAFYDANKSGNLVSRIMSDVEGVRNLVGTGIVDFVGGVLTSILALFVLLHTSVTMTGIAFFFMVIAIVALTRAF